MYVPRKYSGQKSSKNLKRKVQLRQSSMLRTIALACRRLQPFNDLKSTCQTMLRAPQWLLEQPPLQAQPVHGLLPFEPPMLATPLVRVRAHSFVCALCLHVRVIQCQHELMQATASRP